MKFLVDVNASGAITKRLQDLGHDVAEVVTQDERMKDEDILTWAVREQRIIVTTDQDFEEMVWRANKSHKGILRLENLPRKPRLMLLEAVLEMHGPMLAKGAIVIAMSRKIRIRRIPDR